MNKYNEDRIKAVADKIIKLMEDEGENWYKPFSRYTKINSTNFLSNKPFNIVSGNNYSGFNVLNLTLEQLTYSTPAWITFKQAKQLGGSVLKGEKGTPICFYSQVSKKNEDGDDSFYRLLKWTNVFNLDQTNLNAEDLIKKVVDKNNARKDEDLKIYNERKIATIDSIDQFVKNTKADIRHTDAGRCYFVPSQDYINMSPLDTWNGKGDISAQDFYYSVLMHELTHWTGHKSRLNRDDSNPFKNENAHNQYAFEELVAEFGSAFMSATLGMTKTPIENHSQYLAGWIKGLKDKPSLLMKATAQAQKACDLMYSFQDAQPLKAVA